MSNTATTDIAGEVVAVGTSVTAFRQGDRVLAFASAGVFGNLDGGAFQTYTLARTLSVSKLPANLTFEQGAVIPMGIATASAALFDSLGFPLPTVDPDPSTDQSSALLVWGGSSSVGSNVIQLGRLLGFTVFATASSVHHEYLKSIGASEVFDYHSSSVVDGIVKAAEAVGKPIVYAVDAISEAATLQASVEVLQRSGAKGSKLALVLGWPESVQKPKGLEVIQVGARNIFTKKNIAIWVFGNFLATALENKNFVPSPPVQLVEGGLRGLQTGLNILKKGVSGAKIVTGV